jgi:NAD-dependent dihydropyrimidine dehydrogenase PreA subunit
MAVIFNSLECVGCGDYIDTCKNEAFQAEKNYGISFHEDKCLDCSPCAVVENCCNECVTQIPGEADEAGTD